MIHQRLAALLLATAVLGIAPQASADLPPPPDYVEECTRAKQEADDEYCELRNAGHDDPYGCLASGDNDPADPQACAAASKPDESDCCAGWIAAGWSFRCTTYGATAFDALWCRDRKPGDPARPEDTSGATTADDGGGCAIAGAPSGGAGVALLWLALGAALLRRQGKR
jgi:hypothetical protein